MDEATAELIGEKNVWLSAQPFLDDEDAKPYPKGSPNRAKFLQIVQGTDVAYGFAIKHKLKTAWGTDTLFDQKLAARQGGQSFQKIAASNLRTSWTFFRNAVG
jgi:hypothetical protein